MALCADVDGSQANSARVLGNACSGSPSQRWNSHNVHSARDFATRIADADARSAFLRTSQSAEAGTHISLTTGLALQRDAAQSAPAATKVISAGGGKVISLGH